MFDLLIPTINQLQDIFSLAGASVSTDGDRNSSNLASSLVLDLPQIVVVGSQSSGKSSVLEAIVGKDFLPRGSGIVTRRPLILQLFHREATSSSSSSSSPSSTTASPPSSSVGLALGNEWGEFLHKPGTRFFDFSEIRREIEAETDRVTGTNKGVSDAPIRLRIYSPKVINLTLVDLPGITRVPVGNQPKDIEARIRDMVLQYISKPNAVILAVTPANTDLANSDALKLAKEVDHAGKRTVGVLTKLDLMDKGTNALDILTGQFLPLELGYVGVVNRSQADIVSNKPVSSALEAEAQFFATHPLYRSIAHRCGIPFLSSTLQSILLSQIRAFLPSLKSKLMTMLVDVDQELSQCGTPLEGVSGGSRSVLLLDIITKCAEKYRSCLYGEEKGHPNELGHGARIHFIFNDVFGHHVLSLQALQGITEDVVKATLHNAAGTKPALFIAESAFELLIKKQILLLKEPSLQCVELVHDELKKAVFDLDVGSLKRFDMLKEAILEVFRDVLRFHADRARKMVENLIDVEVAFINIYHPDFDVVHSELFPSLLKESLRKSPPSPHTSQFALSSNASSSSSSSSTSLIAGGSGGGPSVSRQSSSRSVTRSGGGGGGGGFGGGVHSQVMVPVSLAVVPQHISGSSYQTGKEKFELEAIQKLLISYFSIVRKKMLDLVPKLIMHFLINESNKSIQNALIQSLYNGERYVSLMEESPALVAKRSDLQQLSKALQKAQYALQTVVGSVSSAGSSFPHVSYAPGPSVNRMSSVSSVMTDSSYSGVRTSSTPVLPSHAGSSTYVSPSLSSHTNSNFGGGSGGGGGGSGGSGSGNGSGMPTSSTVSSKSFAPSAGVPSFSISPPSVVSFSSAASSVSASASTMVNSISGPPRVQSYASRIFAGSDDSSSSPSSMSSIHSLSHSPSMSPPPLDGDPLLGVNAGGFKVQSLNISPRSAADAVQSATSKAATSVSGQATGWVMDSATNISPRTAMSIANAMGGPSAVANAARPGLASAFREAQKSKQL